MPNAKTERNGHERGQRPALPLGNLLILITPFIQRRGSRPKRMTLGSQHRLIPLQLPPSCYLIPESSIPLPVSLYTTGRWETLAICPSRSSSLAQLRAVSSETSRYSRCPSSLISQNAVQMNLRRVTKRLVFHCRQRRGEYNRTASGTVPQHATRECPHVEKDRATRSPSLRFSGAGKPLVARSASKRKKSPFFSFRS